MARRMPQKACSEAWAALNQGKEAHPNKTTHRNTPWLIHIGDRDRGGGPNLRRKLEGGGVKILNFRGSRNLTLPYRDSIDNPQFGGQKSKLSKGNFRGELPRFDPALSRSLNINNSPGMFSCIHAGANTSAACIRTEMNAQEFGNMWKILPQKCFQHVFCVRASANTGLHVVAPK